MLRVGGVILALAVYIWTVVDTIRTPSTLCRTLPKAVWVLIAILLPLLGAVLWILFGRPKRERRRRRRGGQVAPDDDPAFLRQLDQETWSQRMRRRRGEPDGGNSDSAPNPA